MGLPIYKRKFRSFISSAHVDRDIVEQIRFWLVNKADIPILYDSCIHSAETLEEFEYAVELCQSIIIVLTQNALETGWVRTQFDAGAKQTVSGKYFPIITIRIEDCEVPEFLRNTRLIDMSAKSFDPNTAGELLLELYSNGAAFENGRERSVFISHSWGREDPALLTTVCDIVKRQGFQLVSRAPNQQNDDNDTAQAIIAGSGGIIGILSNGIPERTKRRIIRDVETARTLRVPYAILIEGSEKIPSLIAANALGVLRVDENNQKTLNEVILNLLEEWITPPKPQYIFYGTDLKDEHKERKYLICRIIEQILSMPCLVGDDIHQGHIQREITNMITNSYVMIADISKENLNTCIEAGIAIGANAPVHLLSGGARQKPPFMFRDRQIWYYENDMELLGIIHKLVAPYRRHVI
jgi:hypothetical protein